MSTLVFCFWFVSDVMNFLVGAPTCLPGNLFGFVEIHSCSVVCFGSVLKMYVFFYVIGNYWIILFSYVF
jgi:hypothetical protein